MINNTFIKTIFVNLKLLSFGFITLVFLAIFLQRVAYPQTQMWRSPNNLEGMKKLNGRLHTFEEPVKLAASVKIANKDLEGANLGNTDLKNADLEDFNIFGAYLVGANLQNSKLKGANLIGTNFQNANLQGANLQAAQFGCIENSHVRNLCTDFRGAKNLNPEQVKKAKNWQSAHYDPEFRAKLGLPQINLL